MNGFPTDPQLAQILGSAAPTTSVDVLAILQRIDSLLANGDGLKWFNHLYVMVTGEVNNNPPSAGWSDHLWISALDVNFARSYFQALIGMLTGADGPKSWQALFEARSRPEVDRIQFAIAGMNAHINHDLALALLQTNDQLGLTPDLASPEHRDFEYVNGLLAAVLPSALAILATGIVGELAQDTGNIGRLLAIWDIRAARNLAWDFSDHLRHLNGLAREIALAAQDQVTSVVGRSVLLPFA
jgi:hypothetical protein